VRVESHAWLAATRETFELRARLDAFEGETLLRSLRWEGSIPREGV